MAQAASHAWASNAHAAAMHAAAVPWHDSLGRGLPPNTQEQLIAAHMAWTAAANAAHATVPMAAAPHVASVPAFAPNSPAFLPQPPPADISAVLALSADSERQQSADLELNDALSKLIQSSDDSSCGNEVPSTPPPQRERSCDWPGGTPAKVPLPLARGSTPELPPGLEQKPCSDDVITSPVVLKLSSMAFPGIENNEASHGYPGWGAPPFAHGFMGDILRGAEAGAPFLAASPGFPAAGAPFLAAPPGFPVPEAAPVPQDREAGAFLLNLLNGNATPAASSELPARGGLGQAKDHHLPTTSPASAGSSGFGEASQSQGRRPTRRGRRAGHSRSNVGANSLNEDRN